ncbi:hypothetical protein D3C76_1271470 [compost metagenome]
MNNAVRTGLRTRRYASRVSTMLKIARIMTPKATRRITPLPSAEVISNRCCHNTRLKAVNKKALAINVTHSGRTALIFNMMIGCS